jgi:uncharacterized protein (DUF362 family)/NAD-dependent dihydropyrimidine dehydrogenase PreA subunit
MQMSKVLILDCVDYEAAEDKISSVFEAFPREWIRKKVLVKPNMLSAHSPDRGITTHPSIVRAATKWLLDAGAEVTVGDNPGAFGRGENEKCARGSGIADAALGCYKNISNDGVVVEIESRFTDHVLISQTVLNADIVISIPKFKTHTLTQVTGAVKNMFGIVVGGEKARIHAVAGGYRNFSEALVDIYQIRPPDLVIMDAIVGMEGNGPSGGNQRQIGKIMASDNGVAMDAVMVSMMGKRPEKICLLKIAEERGLGEIDVSKLEIVGELDVLKKFRMPATFLCHVAGGIAGSALYRLWANPKPVILADKCESCRVCVESCPVKAMSMLGKIPAINRKACIRCYCCQELCPNDAIELRRWVLKGL